MDVTFERTGARRYAVEVSGATGGTRRMDPAPGYDDHIPHDLVHYMVEADLGLESGVFGRAERGGGTFPETGGEVHDRRAARRARRRQGRREARMQERDQQGRGDMALSEMLAGICDVAWRRRHGQRPPAPEMGSYDTGRLTVEQRALVERVLDRLDEIAPVWNGLEIGGRVTFAWPQAVPSPPRAGSRELRG